MCLLIVNVIQLLIHTHAHGVVHIMRVYIILLYLKKVIIYLLATMLVLFYMHQIKITLSSIF